MTEHNIEELRRQLDSAAGKRKAAKDAYDAARQRLQEALEHQSGWLNEVVSLSNGDRFVVVGLEFLNMATKDQPWKLVVRKFRKDGSPGIGNQSLYLHSDMPLKLGQYLPTPPTEI